MDFDNDFYNVYENDPHFRQYYVIEKDYENNFFFRLFYATFIMIIIHVLGYLFAGYVVGYYIHPRDFNFGWKFLNFENEQECKEEDERYEEKYKEKFKNHPMKDLSEEHINNLENCTLMENTPVGMVIMLYSKSTETFWYFCDVKQVSYQYLDTVLRHYVTVFDCKKLYLSTHEDEDEDNEDNKDKDDEDEDNEDKDDEDNEDNEDKDEDKDKDNKTSVFAKFKTSDKLSDTKKDNKNENVSVKSEQLNRYTYKGIISNYQILKKQKSLNQPALDFATFVKMQNDKKKSD